MSVSFQIVHKHWTSIPTVPLTIQTLMYFEWPTNLDASVAWIYRTDDGIQCPFLFQDCFDSDAKLLQRWFAPKEDACSSFARYAETRRGLSIISQKSIQKKKYIEENSLDFYISLGFVWNACVCVFRINFRINIFWTSVFFSEPPAFSLEMWKYYT